MTKRFIWLLDTTYPRRGSFPLEKGKEYDATAFQLHVDEEWVRTGAAKYVSMRLEKKIDKGE